MESCWFVDQHLEGHRCFLRKSCSSAKMLHFSSKEVRQLLHNKFIVILGDSIQRSVYKDLIQLLQNDSLLTSSQMKSKGELHFENDNLIEGGMFDGLHNGVHYREVRQYRTHHHLVRFYFLTRVYSAYMESILNDFRSELEPDVLILNSCVWDVSRYGTSSMMEYRKNLETAFNRLDAELSSSCLVIWNMTMPLGPKIKGGFLIPELQHLSQTLRRDIIEGNFYGATLAGFHLFDVVDLHFHFRFDLGNRVKDGIHWNNVVHRRITNLLLTHVADAWGVMIPDKNPWRGPSSSPFVVSEHSRDSLYQSHSGTQSRQPPGNWTTGPGTSSASCKIYSPYPEHPMFHDDSLLIPDSWGSVELFSGFTSFEDACRLPFHLDGAFQDAVLGDLECYQDASPDPLSYPSHDNENIHSKSRLLQQRTCVDVPHHGLVMRQQPYYRRDASPYRRRKAPFKHYRRRPAWLREEGL